MVVYLLLIFIPLAGLIGFAYLLAGKVGVAALFATVIAVPVIGHLLTRSGLCWETFDWPSHEERLMVALAEERGRVCELTSPSAGVCALKGTAFARAYLAARPDCCDFLAERTIRRMDRFAFAERPSITDVTGAFERARDFLAVDLASASDDERARTWLSMRTNCGTSYLWTMSSFPRPDSWRPNYVIDLPASDPS